MAFSLDAHISKTPGFPKEGITFYDISPALEKPEVLRQAIAAKTDLAAGFEPQLTAGIDARGFLFAMPLALNLQTGTVMIRKSGKLPGQLVEESYALEYGEARIALQSSRQIKGRRVVLCDDLLATGGTVKAAKSLIKSVGGEAVACAVVIHLADLGGQEVIDMPLVALTTYGG